MLRVIYRVDDLPVGVLSDWHEERGLLEFRVARGLTAAEFVPSLNTTIEDFLSKGQWFQLWEGEIISPTHPRSPLRCTYELSRLRPAPLIDIREYKGEVVLHVSPTAPIEKFIPVLNPAIEEFLAGGQWFQLWHGEIVTMDSTGSAAA
ncbi:hypothetical protein [Streptomyces sp. NPDC003857]